MNIDDFNVLFESGRKEYANGGIIGLSADLETYGGYDHGFPGGFPNTLGKLTKQERIELADYMIDQWARFKGASI